MLESLRSPTGRVVFALAASVLLVLATLLIEPGMVAITPALLAVIWISVIGQDWLDRHRPLLVWLSVAGTVTFLLGIVAFVLAN